MDKLKLIDGQFSPMEAKELLLNMVISKIRFHSVNDFSSDIRTGEPEKGSRERISELRETKKRIITLLEEAEGNNRQLEIHSIISIRQSEKRVHP